MTNNYKSGFGDWVENFFEAIFDYISALDAISLTFHILFFVFFFAFYDFLREGTDYFLIKKKYYEKKNESLENDE
mgnify:FL=1